MKRVWLVEVDGRCFGDREPGYLPDWYHTKATADVARRRYVSEHTVDCPTRVVRFDAMVTGSKER